MSWIATAIVGGSVVSGLLSADAADSASDATTDASQASIEEQRRQFNLIRQDTAPYRVAGREALTTLRNLNAGNFNAFVESPGYQFTRDEGLKAIDRSAVARTGGLGGRSVKEAQRYASGLASTEFGNFWNRIAATAGIGQTAVGQSGTAGMNAAGNIGNAYMTAGAARGANEWNRAQGINNAFQGGVQNYMLYDYLARPAPAVG